MLDRRRMIAGAAATFAAAGDVGHARPATTNSWRKVSPAEAGFTADLGPRLEKLIADKRVWNLHGVLVVRNRQVALERYFEGEDNNWGQSIGVVTFGTDTLHNLYSATKSIVALVYGIGANDEQVSAPRGAQEEQ